MNYVLLRIWREENMTIKVRAIEIQDARAIHRICIQDDVLPYMVSYLACV